MQERQEALESHVTSCDENVKSCSCSDTNDAKPLVAGLSQVRGKNSSSGKSCCHFDERSRKLK